MAKILIAEDDLTSRRMLVKIVESMGHVAIQASDGELAWGIMADNPDIALLITDVMMPNLDGRALIQIARGNDKLKDLPIIIISGVIKLEEIDYLLQLGASRFMPKPVKAAELKHYVEVLL